MVSGNVLLELSSTAVTAAITGCIFKTTTSYSTGYGGILFSWPPQATSRGSRMYHINITGNTFDSNGNYPAKFCTTTSLTQSFNYQPTVVVVDNVFIPYGND